MKVRATATAMGAALLCGFAAPVDHSFDVWGTGGDSLAFNRMTGN